MANKYVVKIETTKTTRIRKEKIDGVLKDITEEVYVGYIDVTKFVKKFLGDIVEKAILVVDTIGVELLEDKRVWINGIAPGENRFETWCNRLKSWEENFNLCGNLRVDEELLAYDGNDLFIWFTNGKSIVLDSYGTMRKIDDYSLDLKALETV